MFEAIRANRIRSVILLTGLFGVYAALGGSIGFLIQEAGARPSGGYASYDQRLPWMADCCDDPARTGWMTDSGGFDESGNPLDPRYHQYCQNCRFQADGTKQEIAAAAERWTPRGSGIGLRFGPPGWGIIVAGAFWVLLMLIAWVGGKTILLASVGARRIQREHHPVLWNCVEEMCIASGQPMPAVYIVEDSVPNAFATGLTQKQAALAVTRGLLDRLNRDELQGVVAHELGHVKNRDVAFLTFAGVTVGAIVILGDLTLRALQYSRGGLRIRGKGAGAVILVLLVIMLLAFLARLFAYLFYFAISRRREYMADACSAVYTRYPPGLASALEKIAGAPVSMRSSNSIVAPMWLVAPGILGLFSTHPPIEKRVMILRAMGTGASYRDYAAAWQKVFGAGAKAPIGETAMRDPAAVPVRAPTAEPEPKPQERMRMTKDAVLAATGYSFSQCRCGVRLKLPAGRAGAFRCPKCGTPI